MAKIRNGFVSNSSSSSFIVSSKEEPKIHVEISLRDLSSYIVSTKEELDKAIKEHFYTDVDELEGYEKIIYNKCLKQIELGNTLYFGTVANDFDNPVNEFVYYNGFGKDNNFDIIQDLG